MTNNGILNITGTIVTITPAKEVGSNGKTKREVVLSLGGDKYPQEVPFEAFGDRVELLEDFNDGDEVSVSFALRGREYNGRYYSNNSLIGIEPAGAKKAKPAAKKPGKATPAWPSWSQPAAADDDIDF